MEDEKRFVKYTPELLDHLMYPAYLLNEDRVFVYRNSYTASRLIPFHLRSRIDRHLSSYDRRRVKNMKIGDEIFISLTTLDCYGGILMRQEDGYCLAIRHITAQMASYISSLAIAIPSFFGDSEEQIKNLRLAPFASPDEMKQARYTHNRALRYQTEIATYFRVTNHTIQDEVVSEISTPISTLLNACTKMLRPNGYMLSNHLYPSVVYAMANAQDLSYAIATLIAVAAENLEGTRIFSESHVINKKFYISITFEPHVSDEAYEGLLSNYYRGDLLCGPFRTMFFDLLLVQMLSEACEWKFTVSRPGVSGGMICMTIEVPLVPDRPVLFNSPPDYLPLIEMQLVNVLGVIEE